MAILSLVFKAAAKACFSVRTGGTASCAAAGGEGAKNKSAKKSLLVIENLLLKEGEGEGTTF